jgi:hypothetical protein
MCGFFAFILASLAIVEKKLVYDRLLGLFNINAYFNACYVYYPIVGPS